MHLAYSGKTMFRTSICHVILAVIAQVTITGAQTQLTPLVLQKCIEECEKQGFCCGNRLNGEAPYTAAERLSCANGCEIAYYSTKVSECKDYCEEGNQEGCTYKHPLIATEFSKCKSCQEGCNGSPSLEACNIGCEEASKHNVYNPGSETSTSWLIEAEEAQFNGGGIISELNGYTGLGYFSFNENAGNIQFNLDIDSDSQGSYLFQVRYATKQTYRYAALIFDGAWTHPYNFLDYYEDHDEFDDNESTIWFYTDPVDILLPIGAHTLILETYHSSIGLNIDHVQLSKAPTASPTPSSCDSKAPRGYVFVPHTNANLAASDVAPLLKIMYCDQDCADILLSNEPNLPNFKPGCGLLSNQGASKCQRSNAGLFYWPSGERNAYSDPPYSHDRTKMIAHARDGVNGYGEAQSLVIHPESSYAFLNPGDYGSSNPGVDIPEYVYEGVRLWSEVVEGDLGSGRVLLVLSKIEDAGAVFGIASTFRSMGVSIIPVVFAVDLLPEALKDLVLQETSPYDKEILAAIEAGCLYSHEMDQQFVDEGLLHNHFSMLSPSDISDILAAAHQAVQDGKQFSDALSWASSVNINIPQAGGASWFGSVKTRNLRYETWGTSTESGLKNAYGQIVDMGGMSASFLGNSNKGDSKPSWKGTVENPSDIMLKRSMASYPGPSDYFPDEEEVKRYRVWMKFDYQVDKISAVYGDWNVQCLDASYYGATYNAVKKVLPMIRNGQKANYFPTRWFMAQEVTESPYPPGSKVMSDIVHISGPYLQGMASGMLTLVTGGRSFIGDKPNDDVGSSSWHYWHARRTGYILAWRLATLCLRPPFLEVKPTSSANSDAFRYGTEPGTGVGSATVRLLEAPDSDVLILIEVDDDADGVVITPNNIVLTPSNYISPIHVYVVTSGKVVKGTEINVFFRTSSDDEAVDGIEDMWMFKTGDQPLTSSPTDIPTDGPTSSPTDIPTDGPTSSPTDIPTDGPTSSPTDIPTDGPTSSPTDIPTDGPTSSPTDIPTDGPTSSPTDIPTDGPTSSPTDIPTYGPTSSPTDIPPDGPTSSPTDIPTSSPTEVPTDSPTAGPTKAPNLLYCTDSTTWSAVKSKKFNCAWIQTHKKKQLKKKCKLSGKNGRKAKDACPLACNEKDACAKPKCWKNGQWEPKKKKSYFKKCSDLEVGKGKEKKKILCQRTGSHKENGTKVFAYEVCGKCGHCDKSSGRKLTDIFHSRR